MFNRFFLTVTTFPSLRWLVIVLLFTSCTKNLPPPKIEENCIIINGKKFCDPEVNAPPPGYGNKIVLNYKNDREI